MLESPRLTSSVLRDRVRLTALTDFLLLATAGQSSTELGCGGGTGDAGLVGAGGEGVVVTRGPRGCGSLPVSTEESDSGVSMPG